MNPRLRPPSVRSISASRSLLGYPCRAATYSQVSHSRQPSGTVSAAVTVTRSGVTTLDDPGRVRELSRMLAGLTDSETAAAHAEELLATAADAKSRD